TYTYDQNSRLLSVGAPGGTTTYTYDGNGNTTSRIDVLGTTTYQYDSLNRLTRTIAPGGGSTSVTQYVYDGLNNRGQKVDASGTTNYLVDRFGALGLAQVLRETDGAGAALADYVYGHDLLSTQRGASVSFFLHDGQLSTRRLVDGSGEVTDSYDFDAF